MQPTNKPCRRYVAEISPRKPTRSTRGNALISRRAHKMREILSQVSSLFSQPGGSEDSFTWQDVLKAVFVWGLVLKSVSWKIDFAKGFAWMVDFEECLLEILAMKIVFLRGWLWNELCSRYSLWRQFCLRVWLWRQFAWWSFLLRHLYNHVHPVRPGFEPR